MDKEEANSLLKLAIKILKGSIVDQPNKGRIGDCLYLMSLMRDSGMWWQANRLQNWIHKFQGGDFDGLPNMSGRLGQNEARRELLSKMCGFTWSKVIMGRG